MNPQSWAEVLGALRDESRPSAPQELVLQALTLGYDVAPGIVGCSLTELDGAHYRTPAASSELALRLDQAQYFDAAGPCVIAARDRQRQCIDVLAAEPRFPAFVATALKHGVRSSFSLPLSGRYHPTALNLYSAREAAFATHQAQATAQLVARIIAAVTAGPGSFVLDPPDVIAARQRGVRVGAAVEATMRRDNLTQGAAFAVLAQRSRNQGASMHTIADEILTDQGDTP